MFIYIPNVKLQKPCKVKKQIPKKDILRMKGMLQNKTQVEAVIIILSASTETIAR